MTGKRNKEQRYLYNPTGSVRLFAPAENAIEMGPKVFIRWNSDSFLSRKIN